MIHHRDLDAAALDAGTYGELAEQSLDVVRVRGLLAPDLCAAVVARLETPEVQKSADRRDRVGDDGPQVSVLGVAVSPSGVYPRGPEPTSYFGASEAFAAWLGEIFAPEPPAFEKVHRALRALSGCDVRRPQGPDAPYGAATLRRVPTGCEMGFHCENAYGAIAVYDALRPLARLDRQTSWFVVLEAPARGGELEVTDRSWERHGRTPPEEVAERATARRCFAPVAGDLWLLRSGDLYHRITTVEAGVRWTIGGFAAPSLDGREVFAWG
jgi:hypothetical protein